MFYSHLWTDKKTLGCYYEVSENAQGCGLKFGAKLSMFENRYQQANQEFHQRQRLCQNSELKINHQVTWW
jgi:hypothetical protein